MLELQSEVHALTLQAEADSSTIANLKQRQLKLETEVADKDSMIAALQAPAAPVVVDVGVQCQLGTGGAEVAKWGSLACRCREGGQQVCETDTWSGG